MSVIKKCTYPFCSCEIHCDSPKPEHKKEYPDYEDEDEKADKFDAESDKFDDDDPDDDEG